MISQESLAMDTFKDVNILVKFFQNLLDPTLLILKKKKFFLTNKHFFRFIVIDSYSINYKEEIKIKKIVKR